MQFRSRHTGLYCAVAALALTGCTQNNITATQTRQTQVVVVQAGPKAAAGGIMNCAAEPNLRSIAAKEPTTIKFDNATGAPITIYWLQYDGARKSYGQIENGQFRVQATFISHPWLIADAADECLEIAMPGSATQTVILKPRSNSTSQYRPE